MVFAHLIQNRRFIVEFHRDMLALNCLTPTAEPKATDYITQMVGMIEQLVTSDHAYEADGSVWFSVESFEDYGRLSGRSLVGDVAECLCPVTCLPLIQCC